MKSGRLVLVASFLAGCAHWGTLDIVRSGDQSEPDIATTYLGPKGVALPPNAEVRATAAAPPPSSRILAVSRVSCNDEKADEQSCLSALLDEARRIGGNGVYGVHFELVERNRRALHQLVGSVALDPVGAAPLPQLQSTRFELRSDLASSSVTVLLQRREADLERPDGLPIENWQLVCRLPCSAGIEPRSTYRLVAPDVAGDKPLVLEPPIPDRVRVVSREVTDDYSRVWWGLGITLFSAATVGGTLAYFFVNGGASGVAELLVGSLLLPCLVIGIADLVLGPTLHVELTAEPGS